MTFERWTDTDLPPRLRSMIEAARTEAPSERVMERSLVAVGVASAATALAAHAVGSAVGASSAAGATGKFGGSVTLALVLKWGAIGFVGGAATVGVVDGAQQIVARPTPARPLIESGSGHRVPSLARSAEPPRRLASSQPDAPEELAARPPKSSSPARVELPSIEPSELAIEIQTLERARTALREGRANAARMEADVYARRFPSGQFAPEMTYIRMQASDRLGDRAGAASAAAEIVAKHPHGPQLLRARQILARELE